MRSCTSSRSGALVMLALLAGSGAAAMERKQAARVNRYLALGDSYTTGEMVAPDERWPVQLVARLRKQGLAVADPEIVAHTGWTTDELMAGIDRAAPSGRFDLVSLLIGVNNQYRGRDLEEYRRQFHALLGRAVSFAAGEAGRVIVLSIPDWGVTPFARGRDRARIAAEIDRFNAVNRDETEKAGALYVDVTGVSRRAGSPGSESLIVSDGLHPSGEMYAEWARLALPQALTALGGARTIDLTSRLDSLVEAERSFARRSESDGTRAAFLAYLAEGSVIFNPGPVDGLKTWRERSESPGLLTWYPVYADVSHLGDLGYTTGPWEYRGKRSDTQAAAHGQYLSVWKRQPGGAWKVALDIGTTNPAPATGGADLSHPPLDRRPPRKLAPEMDPAASRRRVRDLDQSFTEAFRSVGAPEAYRQQADAAIRILRDGIFPAVGVKAAVEAAQALAGALTWRPERADVALDGDLAYTYGAYEIGADERARRPAETGSYARIWKRDRQGRFRLVAEVLHPDPPRRPAS